MSVTYVALKNTMFGHVSVRIYMHFVFNLLCINRLSYYHTIIDVRAIVTNGKCLVINKFTLLLYYQHDKWFGWCF